MMHYFNRFNKLSFFDLLVSMSVYNSIYCCIGVGVHSNARAVLCFFQRFPTIVIPENCQNKMKKRSYKTIISRLFDIDRCFFTEFIGADCQHMPIAVCCAEYRATYDYQSFWDKRKECVMVKNLSPVSIIQCPSGTS